MYAWMRYSDETEYLAWISQIGISLTSCKETLYKKRHFCKANNVRRVKSSLFFHTDDLLRGGKNGEKEESKLFSTKEKRGKVNELKDYENKVYVSEKS